MAHGLSCSAACGIFPDQGSNPCLPCIGRRILNHCAIREALFSCFLNGILGNWLEIFFYFNVVIIAINSPLSTAVSAYHQIWYVVFRFIHLKVFSNFFGDFLFDPLVVKEFVV